MSEFFQGVTFANQNVTPVDDAILRRRLLSDGILTGCELTYAGYTLTMAAGYLIACGRQIRRPTAENWAISDATSGYARVLMTVDLTRTSTEDVFDQVNTAIQYATSADGFPALIQDDINATGSEYHLVLAVVSLGTGGITGIISSLSVAASGSAYNLLHNSDFMHFVAQAGIGGLHGTQAYAGDRWILVSGTVTGEANANGDGYKNITLNGTIRQTVANPTEGDYALGCDMVSGTADITYADGAVTITSAGGVIRDAGLYNGKMLPKYQPKGYAAELSECMRYYQKINPNGTTSYILGVIYSATESRFLIPIPVKMRVSPTITASIVGVRKSDGTAYTYDSIIDFIDMGNFIHLRLKTIGASAGLATFLFNTPIELSADL